MWWTPLHPGLALLVGGWHMELKVSVFCCLKQTSLFANKMCDRKELWDDHDIHSVWCPPEESPNISRDRQGNFHFIPCWKSLLLHNNEEKSIFKQHRNVGQELRNTFHAVAVIHSESNCLYRNLKRRFQLPIFLWWWQLFSCLVWTVLLQWQLNSIS